MKKKLERHLLLPLVLLIYTIVMAIYSYPNYRDRENKDEFYIVVAVGVVLPVLLYFILKRRKKIRDEFTKSN